MRSILLHANRDENFPRRLQVALDLARQFDAHLTCIQPISYEVVVPGDFYGTMMSEMVIVLREAADAFREDTEKQLAKEDVRWTWIDRDGPEEHTLLEFAPLSDLLVVGAIRLDAGRGPSPIVGSLAIHAATPLLVVPREQSSFSAEDVALVAWNSSPEASNALRAAVPFLSRARSVYVATVAEEKAREYDIPPLRGVEYLARHGIEAEIIELPPKAEGVTATLEEAARARGAGYLVMGAYGHSRLRQTLFGGVTRSMLTEPSLPLFLAH